MTIPLKVLIIEDSEDDALLLTRELKKQGYDPEWERVETAEDMRAALEKKSYDIVMSDYVMPQFDGLAALRVLQDTGIDIPFIIISGTIGEKTAVEAMRAGANDYMMKDNLNRLGEAARREIKEAENREALKLADQALKESEERYRIMLERSYELIQSVKLDGTFDFVSASWMNTMGYSQEELSSLNMYDVIHPDSLPHCMELFKKVIGGEVVKNIEATFVTKDGREVLVEGTAVSRNLGGEVTGTQGFFRDITEQKLAESKVEHLNRVLLAVRNVNQLIAREKDPKRLIEQACQYLIASRGYQGAWIALFDESEKLVLSAQAGVDEAFADMVEQIERGKLPHCGKDALSQPGALVTASPQTVCKDCPLSHNISGRGSLTVRIAHNDKVFGLLSVNLPAGFVEDDDEKGLFEEVAGDIAFALNSLEVEKQHKQAVKRLKEAETELEHTIEVVPCIIATANAHTGHFTDCNPALTKILGHSSEEFLSRPFVEFIHPDDRQSTDDEVKKQLKGSPVARFENRYICKDGTYRWLEWMATAADDNGVVYAAATDITERKQADEALRVSQENFERIFNQSMEGILLADPDTKLLHMGNKTFLQMTGYTQEEISELDVMEVHPAEDLARVMKEFEKQARQEINLAIDIPVKRKDGSVFYADVNTTPVTLNDKIFLMGTFRDVTERRQMEEKLLQSQKLEAVGRLAGGIAHDFNNMLTVINTHTVFLLEELDNDNPVREGVLIIQDTAERSALLVKQMMAFSRKQIQQLEVIDLNTFIGDFVKMMKPALGEDIEIRITIANDLGPIRADRSQVEQVIMNLAVNARDAMPLGGKLIIETANVKLHNADTDRFSLPPGSYVSLEISDTGTGMDKETLSQIFEPFFTTKDVDKGTGLGLSSVYGIIKQNNGSISASSTPGSGTTFTILLPRFSDKIASQMPSFPATVDLDGEETILLVEDNKALRKGVRRILAGNGYQVLDADNGIKALEICEQHNGQIDLLLTDMVMPKMNGIDLAERVRKQRPQIHVLLMSGYADGAIFEKEEFKDYAAFLLQKPFAPKVLLTRIRELLNVAEDDGGKNQ